MQKFDMVIASFRQVQAFVALAMEQKFEIFAGNDHQSINGKDIVGMSSLDYSRPITVLADCSQEEFDRFRTAAARLF